MGAGGREGYFFSTFRLRPVARPPRAGTLFQNNTVRRDTFEIVYENRMYYTKNYRRGTNTNMRITYVSAT